MSTPTQSLYKLPHSTKVQFLHLLRRLLREASYLPDSAARNYFRTYIVARFRAHTPRSSRSSNISDAARYRHDGGGGRGSPIKSAERASHLLRQGHKALNGLRRANAGYLGPLTRALRMTYGRVGKRRHDLLAPYLEAQSATPENDSALRDVLLASSSDSAAEETTTAAQPKGPRFKAAIEPTISPALRALAVAQRNQPPESTGQVAIRRIDPVIPATNTWGRPMPLKRVKNIKKREYESLVDRLLAPLPRPEWERLRNLAVTGGSTKGQPGEESKGEDENGQVGRRLKATGWDQAAGEEEDYVEAFIHSDSRTFRDKIWGGKRELSARFMRRLWGRIYAQCPVIQQVSVNEPSSSSSGIGAVSSIESAADAVAARAWKVEWGRQPCASPAIPDLSAAEARTFAAVDGSDSWNRNRNRNGNADAVVVAGEQGQGRSRRVANSAEL